MHSQVNHYSHFLLTQLLMPRLSQSPDPRVILLSSALAKAGVDFRNDMKLVWRVRIHSHTCALM